MIFLIIMKLLHISLFKKYIFCDAAPSGNVLSKSIISTIKKIQLFKTVSFRNYKFLTTPASNPSRDEPSV